MTDDWSLFATLDILMISNNGGKKIMQAITITSGHATRMRKVEPHDPVQRNIYQSNTYRKDLN